MSQSPLDHTHHRWHWGDNVNDHVVLVPRQELADTQRHEQTGMFSDPRRSDLETEAGLFLSLGDGRQLEEVPTHDQLDASKRRGRPPHRPESAVRMCSREQIQIISVSKLCD